MILEAVLIFVMNTQQILFRTIPAPVPLNYCVGYQARSEIYLSCKTMDEKVFDLTLKENDA